MRLGLVAGGIVTVATLGVLGSATADEAKTPVSASMLINNVLSRPIDQRQTAFDASLKEDGPAPRSRTLGEVQPDGSVKYGNVSVIVKNPCPPGTDHYEPPPLPGRRARK